MTPVDTGGVEYVRADLRNPRTPATITLNGHGYTRDDAAAAERAPLLAEITALKGNVEYLERCFAKERDARSIAETALAEYTRCRTAADVQRVREAGWPLSSAEKQAWAQELREEQQRRTFGSVKNPRGFDDWPGMDGGIDA